MAISYGVQIMDNAFLTAPYSLSAYAYEDTVYRRGDFYGVTIDGELKTPKDAFPDGNNWFRLCYPLPVNKTVEVRVRTTAFKSSYPRPIDFVKNFVIGDVDEAYLVIHIRDAERGYNQAPSCIYGCRIDEVYVVTYTAP